MSFRQMLSHTCDIYHLERSGRARGYGLPDEERHAYPEKPDYEGVACYIVEKSQSLAQGEPGKKRVSSYSATFLIGTDIRVNDKLVFEGTTLKAQVPRKIKNHHIVVTAVCDEYL